MTTRTPQEAPSEAPLPPENSFDGPGEARRLLRAIRAGALATLAPDGTPFASLVNVATGMDGSPVLLLSRLAGHTRHLEADPRCSLLLADGGKGDPLAHPRLTVVGDAARDPDPALRDRFLRRHPKSALYADFPDFSFWRLSIRAGHLNGGFARAATLTPEELLVSTADAEALLAGEAGAVAHMNADHADAVRLYAMQLAKQADGPWRMTGVDPEGMDLAAGERTARVRFLTQINSPGELRATLVELVRQARGGS